MLNYVQEISDLCSSRSSSGHSNSAMFLLLKEKVKIKIFLHEKAQPLLGMLNR